jgi:hypothetical protein
MDLKLSTKAVEIGKRGDVDEIDQLISAFPLVIGNVAMGSGMANREEIINHLIAQYPKNIFLIHYSTAIGAAEGGHLELLEKIIDRKINDESFFEAALQGDQPRILSFLLEELEREDEQNRKSFNALLRSNLLAMAVRRGAIKCLPLLIGISSPAMITAATYLSAQFRPYERATEMFFYLAHRVEPRPTEGGLVIAARAGNKSLVQRLLKEEDIDTEHLRYAISEASSNGHYELADMIARS